MARVAKQMKQNSNTAVFEAIRDLLLNDSINTQEQLIDELNTRGLSVNQSKISRMLRKIGAVKTTNDQGQSVYSLPREPAPLASNRPLANLVIDIEHNESLIIVHSSPGSASLIARMLDHNAKEIFSLGTVAGDDTVLVIPKSTAYLATTLQKVKLLLSTL